MMTNAISAALDTVADTLGDLREALAALGEALAEQASPSSPAVADDMSPSTREGRRRRQAVVLQAVEAAGGRAPWQEVYRVARTVGYNTRGLAGFSTKKADLLRVERRDDGRDNGFRLLTERGRRRLEVNRYLLPTP